MDVDLWGDGVENLRLADASVKPGLVSANTNATVLAIAERIDARLGATGAISVAG